MFLPSFRHLIEIDSLKKQNHQNLMHITSETKRISDLADRRAKTKSQIEKLTLEESHLNLASTLENLGILEARLKKLNYQLSLAVTEKEQIAFDNQILLIKAETEKLEQLYFENLETSESIFAEIETKRNFLEGSLVTLEEIKSEVNKNISEESKIIDNRNLRIQTLIDLVYPALKSVYLELELKFKPKSSISYLIDKKCSECHMQTDSILKNSLEEGRSIEICPACGRLLIPETAKIY